MRRSDAASWLTSIGAPGVDVLVEGLQQGGLLERLNVEVGSDLSAAAGGVAAERYW